MGPTPTWKAATLYDDPSRHWRTSLIYEVATGLDARAMLDNGCYVFSPERAARETAGTLRHCPIISQAQGSVHQSQFHLEVAGGPSPLVAMGEADVILFVSAGEGAVEIGDRRFDIAATDGIYVRAGEGFSAETPIEGTILTVLAAACRRWRHRASLTPGRDCSSASAPERVVKVDADQRRAMGERWFQMLVDKAVGSTTAAQFIGHIPLSKAEPHRHLYEE